MLTCAHEGGSQSLLLSAGSLVGLTSCSAPANFEDKLERTRLQSLLLPRVVSGPVVEAGVSEESIGRPGWVGQMKKRHEHLVKGASPLPLPPLPPLPAIEQTRRRLEPCPSSESTSAGLIRVVDVTGRLHKPVSALSRAAFVDLVKGGGSSTLGARPPSAFPKHKHLVKGAPPPPVPAIEQRRRRLELCPSSESTHADLTRVVDAERLYAIPNIHGSSAIPNIHGSSTQNVRRLSTLPDAHHVSSTIPNIHGSSTRKGRRLSALPDAHHVSSTIPNGHGSSTQSERRRSSLPVAYDESIDKYEVPPPPTNAQQVRRFSSRVSPLSKFGSTAV
ncbi:MAG: hypothetical protein KVP17_002024 [Porospora cf. gigantea B]|uniref:uncharacterized protein n=1 Tax=Porospora cf. gigantea B TaxID=2853592 RepID=UPI003571D2CA|nr:MAG: hypothetical protein KVP17_002024 [Porospora cf. gigantea B]